MRYLFCLSVFEKWDRFPFFLYLSAVLSSRTLADVTLKSASLIPTPDNHNTYNIMIKLNNVSSKLGFFSYGKVTLDNIPCTLDSMLLVDGEIVYSSPSNQYHRTSSSSHGTFHLSTYKIRNRRSKYYPWGDTYPHTRHRSMTCCQRYIDCCSLFSKEKSRSVSFTVFLLFFFYFFFIFFICPLL